MKKIKNIFKIIYNKIITSEREERLKAINSCWYCTHRLTPEFEMFECSKKQVWQDGRGIIGRVLGIEKWKEYTMGALVVKGYKCKLYKRGRK